jgi:16S rRNA (uracil1498-N3)-methyltransferase
MQFIFCDGAGENTLALNTKEYVHIFKVRRVKIGKILDFRNMKDDTLYSYKIINIDKKQAILELTAKKQLKIEAKKSLHVGWCIADPKTIEKILPFLNELGVDKISFVYCEFSQQNFKLDLKRIKRILINSSQQCGRSSFMKIEILKDLDEYLTLYPQSKIIDFSENKIDKNQKFSSFLVGCEGGFSQVEREKMNKKNIVGLDNPMILRSETAVLTLSVLNS